MSEIEKCENSMRIIDHDVDVNLLLCTIWIGWDII